MPVHGSAFAVKHQLEQVSITIDVGSPIRPTNVHVVGRSSGKRGDLWSTTLTGTEGGCYEASDWLHTLVLSILQDRPRSSADLERALRGGQAWEDTPLF